jgi:hypothetical protein
MNTYSKSLVMVFSIGIITQGTLNAEGFWDRFKPTPEFLEKIGYRSEPRDYGNVPEYENASPFDLYQQRRLAEEKTKKYQQLDDPGKVAMRFDALLDRFNEWQRLREKQESLIGKPGGKSDKTFWLSKDYLNKIPYSDTAGPKKSDIMWVFPGDVEPETWNKGRIAAAVDPRIEEHDYSYPNYRFNTMERSYKMAVPYTYTEYETGRSLERPTTGLEDRLNKLDKQISDAQHQKQRIINMMMQPQSGPTEY